MTTKEQEEDTKTENTQKFIKKVIDILERWQKVMNSDENDVMSAFIVDQFIKSILIKFDSVFYL